MLFLVLRALNGAFGRRRQITPEAARAIGDWVIIIWGDFDSLISFEKKAAIGGQKRSTTRNLENMAESKELQILDPHYLDRVTLEEVRTAWTGYWERKERCDIYAYLHMVFELVQWWWKSPKEKNNDLEFVRQENPYLLVPTELYSAAIAITADPRKADGKSRSKWSRALRYAAAFKPEKELLRDFLQRKGGINRCATRYTRRLGRRAKPSCN